MFQSVSKYYGNDYYGKQKQLAIETIYNTSNILLTKQQQNKAMCK